MRTRAVQAVSGGPPSSTLSAARHRAQRGAEQAREEKGVGSRPPTIKCAEQHGCRLLCILGVPHPAVCLSAPLASGSGGGRGSGQQPAISTASFTPKATSWAPYCVCVPLYDLHPQGRVTWTAARWSPLAVPSPPTPRPPPRPRLAAPAGPPAAPRRLNSLPSAITPAGRPKSPARAPGCHHAWRSRPLTAAAGRGSSHRHGSALFPSPHTPLLLQSAQKERVLVFVGCRRLGAAQSRHHE